MADPILDFWNDRATLGLLAGTNDFLAKRLEIEGIAAYMRDGMKVLDVGCGNGITAIELARRYRIEVTGIDFAEAMIAAAEEQAASVQSSLKGKVRFLLGRVPGAIPGMPYQLAYTERMIINLQSWADQYRAIRDIGAALCPGGAYLMCENSVDSLARLNVLRKCADLPPISMPWHNRYLVDEEIASSDWGDLRLEACEHFSSTYYLLSRVVNAWLAEQSGKSPEYDAPVNQLAVRLPPIGDYGQTRLWIWRRETGTLE